MNTTFPTRVLGGLLLGLALLLALARPGLAQEACDPLNGNGHPGESCSASNGNVLVGYPSVLDGYAISESAPATITFTTAFTNSVGVTSTFTSAIAIPLSVDNAQLSSFGGLLYEDYVVLEKEARALLKNGLDTRMAISPYREGNDFDTHLRTLDYEAGWTELYTGTTPYTETLTFIELVDNVERDLQRARDLYAFLLVYAPEREFREDDFYLGSPPANYPKPLCGPEDKEAPNPPDTTNSGQVLDPIIDWCSFDARLRQSVREAANLRMILGQEFMVDALGLNFSGGFLGGDEFVKKEVAQLRAARHQFEKAEQFLSSGLEHAVSNGCLISDFYTQSEWSLLSRVAELQGNAQTQIASRESYLGITSIESMPQAEAVAQNTLRQTGVDGYIKLVGLASLGAAPRDDCAFGETPDGKLVAEVAINLRETQRQSDEMAAGRNIYGFDTTFTPARAYKSSIALNCDTNAGNRGLWDQANCTAKRAEALQEREENATRYFDTSREKLTAAVDELRQGLDSQIYNVTGCDRNALATDEAWYRCVRGDPSNETSGGQISVIESCLSLAATPSGEEYLFMMDGSYTDQFGYEVIAGIVDALDHGMLDETLRGHFGINEIPLTDDPTVSVELLGRRWLIDAAPIDQYIIEFAPVLRKDTVVFKDSHQFTVLRSDRQLFEQCMDPSNLNTGTDARSGLRELRGIYLDYLTIKEDATNIAKAVKLSDAAHETVTEWLTISGVAQTVADVADAALNMVGCYDMSVADQALSFGANRTACTVAGGLNVVAQATAGALSTQADVSIANAENTRDTQTALLELSELVIAAQSAHQAYLSKQSDVQGMLDGLKRDLAETQRQRAYFAASPANDPSFRIVRDSARLDLADALEQAARDSYLAARRAEYEYAARLSASNFPISDIYRARTAQDILKYLNELDAITGSLAGEATNETTAVDLKVLVARDIAPRLTDKALKKGIMEEYGIVTPDLIETVRREEFRDWVEAHTWPNDKNPTHPEANDGEEVLVFNVTTSLLKGGTFDNLIRTGYDRHWRLVLSGIGTPKASSTGVSIDLVSEESGLSYRNVAMTQGGLVHLRSNAGSTFDYKLLAPAALLGLEWAANQDPELATAVFRADVNRAHDDTQNGYRTSRFEGRPISATEWEIVVFAGAPEAGLTSMNLQKLTDIELNLSAVYSSREPGPPNKSECTRIDW